MKDTRAKGNTLQQGIAQEEVYKSKSFNEIDFVERGSTETLYTPGVTSAHGVQMLGTADYVPEEAVKCETLTKKGEPCKAYPLKGKKICIGHDRVNGS